MFRGASAPTAIPRRVSEHGPAPGQYGRRSVNRVTFHLEFRPSKGCSRTIDYHRRCVHRGHVRASSNCDRRSASSTPATVAAVEINRSGGATADTGAPVQWRAKVRGLSTGRYSLQQKGHSSGGVLMRFISLGVFDVIRI